MKHAVQSHTSRSGFTLIELLIVIALLGALAVGLLATIDPFEQLKKGKDTAIRNTVSEIYNATLRYYSSKSELPWAAVVPFSAVGVDTEVEGGIKNMVEAGELKSRFADLAGLENLKNILITSADKSSITVCYKPESKSFRNDPSTIYTNAGAVEPAGTCTSDKSTGTAGETVCYYCVQ